MAHTLIFLIGVTFLSDLGRALRITSDRSSVAEGVKQLSREVCNPHDECNTHYVNSYGILTAMDVKPGNPDNDAPSVDPQDYMGKIRNQSTVYVISSALPDFVKRVWPAIPGNVAFVLVTGAAITSVPFDHRHGGKGGKPLNWSRTEFEHFINDSRIIHWFTQNLVAQHPKLSPIPLGIDYRWLNRMGAGKRHIGGHAWGERQTPQQQEDDLSTIMKASKPWQEREREAYADFSISMGSIHDSRQKAKDMLAQQSTVHFQHARMDRTKVWEAFAEHKYVISPLGSGLDCYRTWEALILGSVPIVPRSEFMNDELFEGLPVKQVSTWKEFDINAIEHTMGTLMNPQTASHEKLTLKYWLDRIHQKASFESSTQNSK